VALMNSTVAAFEKIIMALGISKGKQRPKTYDREPDHPHKLGMVPNRPRPQRSLADMLKSDQP
jgi:hypothetical protein